MGDSLLEGINTAFKSSSDKEVLHQYNVAENEVRYSIGYLSGTLKRFISEDVQTKKFYSYACDVQTGSLSVFELFAKGFDIEKAPWRLRLKVSRFVSQFRDPYYPPAGMLFEGVREIWDYFYIDDTKLILLPKLKKYMEELIELNLSPRLLVLLGGQDSLYKPSKLTLKIECRFNRGKIKRIAQIG